MKIFLLSLKRRLSQYDYFFGEKKLLCTFSGGQDSILTLISFLHFQSEYGLQLQTIYCHHFIQLNNFFCFWQLTRINYVFDLPTSMVLTKEYLKNENQARKWRQISFERMGQLYQCSSFLFGHTATDKLETVLSNLKRGLSSRGLASLEVSSIFENISTFSFFSFTFRRKKLMILKRPGCKQKFSKKINTLWLQNRQVITVSLFKYFSCSFYGRINKKNFYEVIFYCINYRNNYVTSISVSKTTNEILKLKFILFHKVSFSNYLFQVKNFFILRRPILSYHRADITKLCQIYNYPLLTDETNNFFDISRNSIRYQILPLFRYFFSLNVEFFISRCFDILFLEQNYIHSKIEKFLKILKTKLKEKNKSLQTLFVAENRILFSIKFRSRAIDQTQKLKTRKFFKNLPIAVQRICLRNLFFESTSIQLNYSQLELLRSVIRKC